MLANHDQNLESRIKLLKVCLCVKLESSVLHDLLCKFARLDRSIEARAECFPADFSNLAQAHMTCRVYILP